MKVSLTKFCDVLEPDFHAEGVHRYGAALTCKLPLVFVNSDWDTGMATVNEQALNASAKVTEDDQVTLNCGCEFRMVA